MPRTLPAPADRLIRGFAAARRTMWSYDHLYNSVLTLNQLTRWLAARQLTLADAGATDLAEYLAERLDSGLSPNTVKGEHVRIKGFYTWACADPGDGLAYIERNPMRRVAVPKQCDPDPARTPEAAEWEYRALLSTCTGRRTRAGDKRALDRRDAAIIAMLWHCGVRRGELVAIEYGNVDWDTQMVHLPKTKGRGRTRSRDVFVPDEAFTLLERYVWERGEHDGALFESTRRCGALLARRALAANSVHLMLVRRCAVAESAEGLADGSMRTRSHGFRRGLASDWLENGGSQVALETHMGWRHDGRMAGQYARKRASAVAAAEARAVAEARAGSGRLRRVG
jgi:integrase